MTIRTGSARRKTRRLLSKPKNEKGKLAIGRYLQIFSPGDKVVVKIETQHHKGMPHSRFYGLPGVVTAKRGRCYMVQISDMGKKKSLIINPVHLRKP